MIREFFLTLVQSAALQHCCSRGEYSTKGSQYRATPRISLPRRDSFFSQTKSCLSGSVHETFPDTIVTNLPGSLSRWIPCGRERCLPSTTSDFLESATTPTALAAHADCVGFSLKVCRSTLQNQLTARTRAAARNCLWHSHVRRHCRT